MIELTSKGVNRMMFGIPLSLRKHFSSLCVNMKQRRIGNTIFLFAFLLCSSWAQADGLFDFQMTLAKKGGNPEAEFKVGEMYETGFGVTKDLNEARKWINKAAAQGHEAANFKLLYWDMEKNGLKGDNKNKFSELMSKADKSDPQAMYYLGKMYAHGVGISKNYDKALDWLDRATFVGVLSAEREAIHVREKQQKNQAKESQSHQNTKTVEKAIPKKPKKKSAEQIAAEKKKKQADRIKAYALKIQQEEEKEALAKKKQEERLKAYRLILEKEEAAKQAK